MSDTTHCPHGRLLAVTCDECEIERLEKQLAEITADRDRVVHTHKGLMQGLEDQLTEAQAALKDLVHQVQDPRAPSWLDLDQARAALKETKE